jgi:hypothetical protein
MRDYGKVYSTFWTSGTTGGMSDTAKLLALYLMTTSHSTIAGVFRIPDGYVAEDLAWGFERVSEGFRELEEKGFATRCEVTKWVWVRRHLEWNKPENPNQVKSAQKIALSVPDACTWRVAFVRENAEALGLHAALQAPPPPNPSATLSEGLRNQKAESSNQKAEGSRQKAGSAAEGAAPPASAQAAPAAGAAATRGTRLPTDWVLPKAWGEWALEKYPHWTADTVRAIASKFKNYWTDKTGKDATKVSWKGTWENWCESGITQGEHPPPKAPGRGQTTAAEDMAASRAKAERVRALIEGGAVVPAATLLPETT